MVAMMARSWLRSVTTIIATTTNTSCATKTCIGLCFLLEIHGFHVPASSRLPFPPFPSISRPSLSLPSSLSSSFFPPLLPSLDGTVSSLCFFCFFAAFSSSEPSAFCFFAAFSSWSVFLLLSFPSSVLSTSTAQDDGGHGRCVGASGLGGRGR